MVKDTHSNKTFFIGKNPIFENRNQHLNPDFNTWLTHCFNILGHGLTHHDKKFLKRCYNIIVLSGIPFCVYDFKEMWPKNLVNSFTTKKNKLKSLFETIHKGKPCYYKLTGLYLDKELTDEYTSIPIHNRIFANLNILLSLCAHEKIQMHNIVFGFKTDGLYQKLKKIGHISHGNAKSITIESIPVDKIVKPSAEIYPNGLVLLRLACTYNPISYSNDGFVFLIHLLGKIEQCLKTSIAYTDFLNEPVNNWKFKHVDFNKDSIRYDFPSDDYTISMVFGHIQVYRKKFPNGDELIRVEDQTEPGTTLTQEIGSVRFQKASEMFTT